MLIGLCSKKPQVGKTTIANHLKKSHDFIVVETSEPIASLAEKFLGYNGIKSDPDQRFILQQLGLCWKSIDPTIWIYASLSMAKRKMWGLATDGLTSSPSFLYYYNIKADRIEIKEKGINNFFRIDGDVKNVVISGIRSKEETKEISDLGGKNIFIDRDIEVEGSKHPVENAIDSDFVFDYYIDNNYDIDFLNNSIETFLRI